MTEKIDFTIIDNSVIGDLMRNDELDLVFANDRMAVITEEIIKEFETDDRFGKLQTWIAEHTASGRLRVIPARILTPELALKYDPAINLNKPNVGYGDASIRKFLIDSGGDGFKYEILTNNVKDFSFEEFLKSRGISSIDEISDQPSSLKFRQLGALIQQIERIGNNYTDKGLPSYIRRLILNADVSLEKSIQLITVRTFRTALAPPAYENALSSLTEKKIRLRYPIAVISRAANIAERALIAGLKTGVIFKAGTLLGPLGIVSDILTLESKIAEAAVLRAEGPAGEKAANRMCELR